MTISTAASDPSRAGGLGCDEPPTKLKVRVGGTGQRGEPEPPSLWAGRPRHQGPGRATPNGRLWRRRHSFPPNQHDFQPPAEGSTEEGEVRVQSCPSISFRPSAHEFPPSAEGGTEEGVVGVRSCPSSVSAVPRSADVCRV